MDLHVRSGWPVFCFLKINAISLFQECPQIPWWCSLHLAIYISKDCCANRHWRSVSQGSAGFTSEKDSEEWVKWAQQALNLWVWKNPDSRSDLGGGMADPFGQEARSSSKHNLVKIVMIKDKMELLFCASNCLVILRAICRAFYSCFNTWKLRLRENILTDVSESQTMSGGMGGNACTISRSSAFSHYSIWLRKCTCYQCVHWSRQFLEQSSNTYENKTN